MYMPEWAELMFVITALAVLVLLAVFLAACTLRVLAGGQGPIVEGPRRRAIRRAAEETEENETNEARVGAINLD